MEHDRPSVRCDHCNLVQFVKPNIISLCRKCRHVLPTAKPDEPQTTTIEVAPPDTPLAGSRLAWGEMLPTYAEIGELLIQEAMRRKNDSLMDACRLIRCGKTTMYRRLRQMKKPLTE